MSEKSITINLLRASQLCEKLKISRSSLYSKLNSSSKYYDPIFPKQVRLGINAVGWIESQVDAWIMKKLCTSQV